MKYKIHSLLFICLATVMLFVVGCGKMGQKYGSEISDSPAVEVVDIIQNAEKYEGKTVKVEGKIIQQCPAGCWFDLQDGKAAIYIDLNPSGFAIPQNVGGQVQVEGEIKIRDGKARMIGKGVELK